MAYSFSKYGDTVVVPRLLADGDVWEERAGEIRRRVAEAMGPAPQRRLHWRKIESLYINGIAADRIVYVSLDGDEISAYLLYPALTGHSGKHPAVMALHQTAPQGKEEIVGLDGNADLKYGWELARRGYLVLAPDELTVGERIFAGKSAFQSAPFEERHPQWSMMGKMLHDHMLGVDLLCSLPDADSGAIGVIGHSLGGYNAMFLAAFDERVKAAVSSCGFSTFAGDSRPERWGENKEWFTHFPRIGTHLAAGTAPFEFHEVAATITPRAFFNWSTQHDTIFPHWEAIAQAMVRIGEIYERTAADPSAFVSLLGVGGHCFPSYARRAAYAWLDERLKPGFIPHEGSKFDL